MIKQAIDNWMNIHSIGDFIAGGGQGSVYRTNDADIAVKFVVYETDKIDEKTGKKIKEPITGKNEIEKENRKFDNIRIIPIPKNLPLALPIAVLRDNAGYAMRLLSSMKPFNSFGLFTTESRIDIDDTAIPKWFADLGGHLQNLQKQLVHYQITGGLRRRLEALSQCAAILARLHAVGLVYADISDGNVFVSEQGENEPSARTLVWLIDADNLRYDTGKGSVIYTEKYGVPEVMQGTGVPSCSGDCYAFAVMAFWMLTMQHPFLGAVIDESEDREDDQKAFAGLLPFVDDPDDDSNGADTVRRSLFLNKNLTALFEDMFCAGRISPAARPPALCLSYALAEAADTALACPVCGMSYYHTENDCPYCDAPKPSYLIVRSFIADDASFDKAAVLSAKKPIWVFARELTKHTVYLPRRIFTAFAPEGNDEPELTLNKGINVSIAPSSSLDFSFWLKETGKVQKLPPHIQFNDFDFFLRASGRSFSRMIAFNIHDSGQGGIR
jgi:serine/threonine protein kinase